MTEPTVVEVIELRPIGRGALKAVAAVRLFGCVVVHQIKVLDGDRGPWVALPQQPARRKADGSGSGWFPVIEITRRELMDQVRDVVLEAWERGQ